MHRPQHPGGRAPGKRRGHGRNAARGRGQVLKRPWPRLRFVIAGLLCLASTSNYLDRQALSVLADTVRRDLGFGATDYADITSAFLLAYMVMYLVGGFVVDRIGTRRSFLLFASAWSLATMAHGLVSSVRGFQGARLLLGATQPVNFPAGVRAAAEWFPMRERALAIGIFNAGTALGSTLAVPVVSAVALLAGWRWAFVIVGASGFLWVAAWALLYRLPKDHPRLGEDERRLIDEGREEAGGRPPRLCALVRMRETWGCVAARVFTDPITYFLTFWVPLYLQQERGFSLAQLGALGWVPFAVYALGNVASGAVPRALIARGVPLDRARKGFMLTVVITNALALLALSRAEGPVMALACLSLVFFGHAAWGAIILPAEVFPARAIGTVSGLGGGLGAAAGVVVQQVVGRLAGAGTWTPIFLGCAVAYFAAQVLVVFLVRDLGRPREV